MIEDKNRVSLEQVQTISRLQDELFQLHTDLDASRALVVATTKASEAAAGQREPTERELVALRKEVLID
jgi:capsule polysaccharide export protein KpsE/RkpR